MQTKTAKPFAISRELIDRAYEHVKAKKGAAGVDGQSIAEFEKNREGNLYKIWNRMSSGSYMPPPVKEVEIPKKGTGSRKLGIPTIADRVAQTAVAMTLAPELEEVFHDDSYAYRGGRSTHDAVERCAERIRTKAWAVDLDIQNFFGSVDHDKLLAMVKNHTSETWVLLYVERWLKAPVQKRNGDLAPTERGTPQGSALSPVLANIFLHYVFDT